MLKGACAPILVWSCPPFWKIGFIPDLNWSAFLSSSLYGSFQFGILCSPELVSFPFKFPVWKLPIWNPSSPELVSFPFKFPVWKLPIWNPSSPVLNWSAFLSSFPVWKQFPVWKLPIWNPSSPELVSFPFFCLRGCRHVFQARGLYRSQPVGRQPAIPARCPFVRCETGVCARVVVSAFAGSVFRAVVFYAMPVAPGMGCRLIPGKL